jgi:TIR domain
VRLKHVAWVAQWEIRPGESIPGRVEEGLREADALLLLISVDSMRSPYVEREWLPMYHKATRLRQVGIIPILLDNAVVPTSLQDLRRADFRDDYLVGFVELSRALEPPRDEGGIHRYYDDFVDITDDWTRLFADSLNLDLMIMYGRSWRNTYLKHIQSLARREGARVRVVLPAHDPRDAVATRLLSLYARRLGTTVADLRGGILEAVSEFSAVTDGSSVEVYAASVPFGHATYAFDSGAVVAFYAMGGGRGPTPALVLRSGHLLAFVRSDFEHLVGSDDGRIARVV